MQQGVAPELPLKPFVFCLADAGQPGERCRYREDKNALATRTSFSDHQLHTRCCDCGRYHDQPDQEMGATKNVCRTDDHVARVVHSVMYRRHLNR